MDGDSDEETKHLRGGGKNGARGRPRGPRLRSARAPHGKSLSKTAAMVTRAWCSSTRTARRWSLSRRSARGTGPVPRGRRRFAAAAKAHYDRVKAQRLAADKADRLREKQRLRDMRDKARAKARKAAGDDHSEDDDVGGAARGGSDSDDDEDAGGRGDEGGDSSDSSDSTPESGSGRAETFEADRTSRFRAWR